MTDAELAGARRFDELVAWYVTGELDPDDRQWVEAWLQGHAEAQASLQWHRVLAQAVDESAPAARADVGWSGLAARLEQERATGVARQRGPATASAGGPPGPTIRGSDPTGIAHRIGTWLRSLVAAPGFAVAAVVIAAQAVVIGALVHRGAEVPEYSTVRGGAGETLPMLQVRFRPDATERDLRLLLTTAGARIVDGPDQLGDWLVTPRQGTLEALREQLQASPLVANVDRHDGRLPAGGRP